MEKPAEQAQELKPTVQKENGWLKFFRVIIYAVTVVGAAVGIGLIKSAATSNAYADGSHEAKLANGLAIFVPSLVLLAGNILWGMLRWFLRYSREQWKARRIIGKLVGGGIWRTLVFVPLFIVSLLTLTPMITNVISENLSDEAENVSFYVPNEAEERLEYMEAHAEELDPETALTELEELFLVNIEFDPDATEPSVGVNLPFVNNVYAATQNVATLTKAKLSAKKNFVVFYTSFGDDAITDEQAEKLAEMLENIIAGYKNNLGFEYEYEKLSAGILKDVGIKNVLKASGIDTNILDTAMPVYVANPYSEPTHTLASYGGRHFLELGDNIIMKIGSLMNINSTRLYNSAPSFPFVNILPQNLDSESLEIVTAHEMGHHYASLWSYGKYGKSGSTENFIDEAAPNWMAINAMPNQPVESFVNADGYNLSYLARGTDMTIKDVMEGYTGYPGTAFLENYYEIVPDGKTKIMDALYYGDALNYLYDQAGAENFARVMTQLTERNLTGDYGGKLTNYTLPKGQKFSCADVCSMNYAINPAASGYVYFVPEEYIDTVVSFNGTNNATASVLGKNLAGEWVVLASGETEVDLEVTEEVLNGYELVTFAVSNPNVTEAGNYTVEMVKTELEDLIAEDGGFEFELPDGDILTKVGDGCYLINTDKAFDYLNHLMGVGSELLSALGSLDETGSVNEAKAQYDADVKTAQENLSIAKNELKPYNITFCANYIKSGTSFDRVKAQLSSAMGQNLNLYNGNDGNSRISAFVGFDVLARRAKAFVLMADGSDMGLVTISVEEK